MQERSVRSLVLVGWVLLGIAFFTCGSSVLAVSAGAVEKAEASRAELAHNLAALKERHLRLLPVPKKLTFTGKTISVERLAVVLLQDTERGRMAAGEVTSVIKELAGREITPRSTPLTGAYNIIIENRWPNRFTADTNKPAAAGAIEQGYGLYPEVDSVTLAGQSEIGTIYAAVTARFMIGRQDGKVVFHPAKVIDWPDFKRRQPEYSMRYPYMEKYRNHPDKYLAEVKKHYDYLFRLKINTVGAHTYQPYQDAFSPFRKKPDASDREIASIRKVNDYLHLRGFQTMTTIDASLGKYPFQKDEPELKGTYLFPWHHYYLSWGRHDLHQIRAEKVARFAQAAGLDLVYVHSGDGGSINDPEMWSKRGKYSRERYPRDEDRARADADVFMIYAKALEAVGVKPAYVQYPYNPAYIDEEQVVKHLFRMPDTPAARMRARRKMEPIRKWIDRIHRYIPLKYPFCVRENSRENMRRWYQAFNKRPFQAYLEVDYPKRNINALLPREIATTGTMLDPAHPEVDYMMITGGGRNLFNQAKVASCSEFLWNTRFPGSSDLDRDMAPGTYDRNGQEILSERAAIGLWGHDGAELAKIFDRHFSLDLAFDPESIRKRLNIKKIIPMMAANHEALRRGEAALNVTWKKRLAARASGRPFMDSYSYPFFVQYFKMIMGCIPYSVTNLAEMQVREKLAKGDFKAAEKTLQRAISELAAAEKAFKATEEKLKGEPLVWAYNDVSGAYYQNVPAIRALDPEFPELTLRLTELWEKRHALFQQNSIPKWFKGFLAGQELVARSVDGEKVTLDGKLSEAIWQRAKAVEYFVDSQILKFGRRPLYMKLAYDPDHIYLAGSLQQPLASSISVPKHGADKYVATESVELFLVPEGEQGDLFQVILDLGNGLFTARRTVAGTKSVWLSGIQSAVCKDKQGWRFEMRIPFRSLGAAPSENWVAMVSYNHMESVTPKQISSYASSFVDGKGFHHRPAYAKLRFADRTEAVASPVRISCPVLRKRPELHAGGTGSLVTFKPVVETKRPLKNVRLSAVFLDKDRQQVGALKLNEHAFVPLRLYIPAPFEYQCDEIHQVLQMNLSLAYETLDGRKGEAKQKFILGPQELMLSAEEIFSPGGNAGRKALTRPVNIPVVHREKRLFMTREGKISMRLRIEEESEDRQCLFHVGPFRPDHPRLTNRNAIVAMLHRRVLSFAVATQDYKLCRVTGLLPTNFFGAWHELTFTWRTDAQGQVAMTVEMDGKILSGSVRGWGNHPVTTEPKKIEPEYSCIQLGALNSGEAPARCAIEDLVIRTRGIGEDTACVIRFDFNGSLLGEYRLAGNQTSLRAHVGTFTIRE